MRRHPKAPSAGSTQRQVTGLGRILRGAFATRGASSEVKGSGAPAVARFSIAAVSLAAALMLIPATVVAGVTRAPEPFSPIDGSGSGVTFIEPGGIAVDEATGNVFLNDDDFSNAHTDILGAEGAAPVGLVSPFQLTGFCFVGTQNGVAFDNSPTSPNQGTLYVVDCGGKVKKFTRNPPTEKYEPAGELTSATSSFEIAATGAAVDTQGNLYVTDALGPTFGNPGVVKFNSAGAQVAYLDLSGSAGGFVSDVAVDADGDMFVSSNGGLLEYPADGTGEIDPSVFNVVLPSASARGLAIDNATDRLFATIDQKSVAQYDATTLVKEFEFGAGTLGQTYRLEVNSATDRIYVSDANNDNVVVFGPPVPIPDATTKAASDVTGTTATLNGVVNPQGVAVTECKFEYGLTTAYGSTVPCEEAVPTDSSDHAVTASISGLEPNGATHHFRLVVNSANGPASPQGADRTLVTVNTVFTEPATAVARTTATLHGTVKPEGEALTECKFEYGPTPAFGQSKPCTPSAGSIPDDFDPHAVSASLTGLQENTTYYFRLLATNAAGTASGEELTFVTQGSPQILEQRPIDATQSSATLQATLNPSGLATTYHFEWGPEGSYASRIPADHELFAGSGGEPVTVSANVSGLSPLSHYHFRVIASNAGGAVVGPDQPFETLNAAGLPDNRGIELVSPADKGSAGSVAGAGLLRAAEDGESLLYPIQNGIPESTSGGWPTWRASRADSSWLSSQVSGPSLIASPNDVFIEPSIEFYASADLGCAILQTYNPLTEDTPQLSVELGVQNLYRWNGDDGSYDRVSNRMPLNPGLFEGGGFYYSQIETSDDCSRIFFRTKYELIAGASGLYEWHEGELRDAGLLPNGLVGDKMSAGSNSAVAGGELIGFSTSRWDAVSPDGERFFFTAISNQGDDSGEQAIFMREDGGAAVTDISQSQTAVKTNGARFEAGSPDGSKVLFRANYGIADTSSAGPTTAGCGSLSEETSDATDPPIEPKACDLYVYDTSKPVGDRLTDLSADPNLADPIGAAVQGVVAVDEDASHVYFAALGQLIPGEGRTYAQNSAGAGSANVYLSEGGDLTYVTTLDRIDLLGDGSGHEKSVLMRRTSGWTAHLNADGTRLLFESSSDLGGYETGGGKAAYLYDAEAEKLSCVSCRPDGQPTLALAEQQLLTSVRGTKNNYRARSISEDGSRIFFSSPDVLAPGATVGEAFKAGEVLGGDTNVYQWEEGQVTFLARVEPSSGGGIGRFLDASADGSDVFIATKSRLTPYDNDFVADVYDIRVDGGFPFEPPPIPCNPAADECQGPAAPQPGAPAPASAAFSGPGNPSAPAAKKRAKKKKKKKASKKRKSAQQKRSRQAKTNRGGAK